MLARILIGGSRKEPPHLLLGRTATGRPVTECLESCPQILCVGSSGSGKTSAIERLLVEAVKAYNDLAIVIMDPKQIGFSRWRDHAYVIDEPREFLRAANACANEAERRYLMMKASDNPQFAPTASAPRVLIVVDEAPDFFNSVELVKSQRSSLQETMIRLSNKARGCGFSMIFGSQSPLTDALPGQIRNNCTSRWIFKLMSPEMAKAATADRVEEADPSLLSLSGEGFFLTRDTNGFFERGRVKRVTEDELREVLASAPSRPYFYALDYENPDYTG